MGENCDKDCYLVTDATNYTSLVIKIVMLTLLLI
jgi:hypothetical protein